MEVVERTGGRTASLSVLVVDDEPEIADLVAIYLERAGDDIAVTTATSTSEGIDLIRERRYDCVVSDYHMDAMDGLAFLDRVADVAPATGRILFSSDDSAAVKQAASEAGVPYVHKHMHREWHERLASDIRSVVRERGQ